LNSKLGFTTRLDSSLTLTIRPCLCIFVYGSLAVRMVENVTETRHVIPSLEFKTCMTIKS